MIPHPYEFHISKCTHLHPLQTARFGRSRVSRKVTRESHGYHEASGQEQACKRTSYSPLPVTSRFRLLYPARVNSICWIDDTFRTSSRYTTRLRAGADRMYMMSVSGKVGVTTTLPTVYISHVTFFPTVVLILPPLAAASPMLRNRRVIYVETALRCVSSSAFV